MFEKVNPSHPDKVADRIAGALVDYAYSLDDNPKIAVEVLIGHGDCFVVTESSVHIPRNTVVDTVTRICGGLVDVTYQENRQDEHLAENQMNKLRCGDNGIFKGVPMTPEQHELANTARFIYSRYPSDGKYVIDKKTNKLIVCQSWAEIEYLNEDLCDIGYHNAIINPLGYWTGGVNVDTGATNRKLGSDMGDAVTGGGLHGKDLSKADVSVNIYAHLKAQETGEEVKLYCAIGDEEIDGKPYSEIVNIARDYITLLGGFEKLAEWGLI